MKNSFNLHVLTRVAMLIALEIILSRFLSINTESLRIGFGFMPMALCGILYGPFWAGAAYAAADILGAVLFSYGFYPGITVSAFLTGLVFGVFLHGEEVRFFPHIVAAVVLNCVLISLGLTSYWLALAQGVPYFARVITRLPQCGAMIIIQLIIIPLLVKLAGALRKTGIA
ncbi:MAG: folate family ECF transporter S component [Oscillospiraceae bacterium]|jgi:ECF transporter S component (folate family)